MNRVATNGRKGRIAAVALGAALVVGIPSAGLAVSMIRDGSAAAGFVSFTPASADPEMARLIEARGIYPPDDTHTMDSAYLDAMRPLAEQRVRQAAWRLAQLLNQTIGAQAAP